MEPTTKSAAARIARALKPLDDAVDQAILTRGKGGVSAVQAAVETRLIAFAQRGSYEGAQ